MKKMRRCVIATKDPWRWIPQFDDCSIMIVNPDAPFQRYEYLIGNSDYSLLVTEAGISTRSGGDYPDERVFWYTSGTTGDSKFYGFSRQQVDRMARTICDAYAIDSNDRYYGIMPLWHAHGSGFYWATRLAGCETRFGSIRDKDEIESFQPTFITSIPDIMSVIARLDLRALRFIRTASSAMPERLFRDLTQQFRVPVIEAFGMTEALSHCFTNPLHGEQRVGTVGLPSGIEACVDNGRLMIKGPCVFRDGWFDTGDLAEQDEKGYYRILGRSRDQINVRGIKINPLSIENQIYERFSEIEEVSVFGKDRLKCVYVGDLDETELTNWLISLGNHCRPSMLKRLDSIPKNNSGKVSRSLLEMKF